MEFWWIASHELRSDMGLQYGALANIYYYGDGSTYPQYFHSFYFEVSRYTKGTGINQFFFDSKKLIPEIRVTADITYLTEKALNFYGFNGYESVYNHPWENNKEDSSVYKTRMFYRYQRDLLADRGQFPGKVFSLRNSFGWQDSLSLRSIPGSECEQREQGRQAK